MASLLSPSRAVPQRSLRQQLLTSLPTSAHPSLPALRRGLGCRAFSGTGPWGPTSPGVPGPAAARRASAGSWPWGSSFGALILSRKSSLTERKPGTVTGEPGAVTRKPETKTRAGGDSDLPAFKGFPPMQTRPAWYWRIFAVAPYFLPLLEGWLYSESAMTVYAPLFHYKVLCSPIVNIFAILPSWFLLAYFFTAYLGVVRNNRWPHFLRFHVVMSMLMEILLQVVGTLNDWIPPSVVWGRFGAHFWLGATLAYVFIVLECILAALKGMYADVPFISDAAYLQIPYE